MQRLEVSGAVRPLQGSLGVKRLMHVEAHVGASVQELTWCLWKPNALYRVRNSLEVAHQ